MTGLVFMLLASAIFKRFGIRYTVFACGILIAFGNFIFSISGSLPGYYASAVIIGIGYGCCSTISVSLLVAEWFEVKRGTAIGLAYAGSGIAAILFSPVLLSIIENYSLSEAFRFQGVSVAALTAAAFLLIRNSPEDKGATPFGHKESVSPEGGNNRPAQAGYISKAVFKTKKYYILLLSILVLGTTVQPVVSHFPNFLISVGYKPSLAAYLVSVYGVTMVLGKTVYGLVIDKLGGYGANFIIFPLWLGTIAISYLADSRMLAAYVFAALTGMGPALATVSLPIWVGDLFSKESFAAVLTSIQITLNLGSSIGMVMMGYLFDVTGSYKVSFSVILVFVTVAFICIQGLYRSNAVNKKSCNIEGKNTFM
jgi:MFS family permease